MPDVLIALHRHALWPMFALMLCALGCANANVRKTAATPPPTAGAGGYTDPREQRDALAFLTDEADDLEPAEQERVTAHLTQALSVEEDPLVREQMTVALGAYHTEQAMVGLRAALSDDEPSIRIAACNALGKQGEAGGPRASSAVDLLTSTLAGDENIDVRLAAARALGTTESPQAVDGLVSALSDADPALRHRATESLKSVTGEDIDDAEAWREYASRTRGDENAANIAAQPTRWF